MSKDEIKVSLNRVEDMLDELDAKISNSSSQHMLKSSRSILLIGAQPIEELSDQRILSLYKSYSQLRDSAAADLTRMEAEREQLGRSYRGRGLTLWEAHRLAHLVNRMDERIKQMKRGLKNLQDLADKYETVINNRGGQLRYRIQQPPVVGKRMPIVVGADVSNMSDAGFRRHIDALENRLNRAKKLIETAEQKIGASKRAIGPLYRELTNQRKARKTNKKFWREAEKRGLSTKGYKKSETDKVEKIHRYLTALKAERNKLAKYESLLKRSKAIYNNLRKEMLQDLRAREKMEKKYGVIKGSVRFSKMDDVVSSLEADASLKKGWRKFKSKVKQKRGRRKAKKGAKEERKAREAPLRKEEEELSAKEKQLLQEEKKIRKKRKQVHRKKQRVRKERRKARRQKVVVSPFPNNNDKETTSSISRGIVMHAMTAANAIGHPIIAGRNKNRAIENSEAHLDNAVKAFGQLWNKVFPSHLVGEDEEEEEEEEVINFETTLPDIDLLGAYEKELAEKEEEEEEEPYSYMVEEEEEEEEEPYSYMVEEVDDNMDTPQSFFATIEEWLWAWLYALWPLHGDTARKEFAGLKISRDNLESVFNHTSERVKDSLLSIPLEIQDPTYDIEGAWSKVHDSFCDLLKNMTEQHRVEASILQSNQQGGGAVIGSSGKWTTMPLCLVKNPRDLRTKTALEVSKSQTSCRKALQEFMETLEHTFIKK